ncbi:MAG TPA: L,D-transpeptidase [Gaiellaceae bacterium]|jgi:lipoprotein-anchoring transpeptidase ErfK/SrfK
MARRGIIAAATLVLAACFTPGSAAPSAATKAESTFPAAGALLVDKIAVRAQPSPTARVVKIMDQFRPDFRLQEIYVVATRRGADGKPWYRISVPMRPNGTMGWIPVSVAAIAPTVSRIVVHIQSRTIDVYWHGHRALHAPVAVGSPGRETPLGHYYVQARFVPDDPFLGVFAVETSAYSKMTEWPGGGVVGIHGTSMPQLLGQAVSHGCVRVANSTAEVLKRYAPLGSPIWITN